MRVTPNLDTINSLEICPKPLIQTYPAITFNGENYVVVWSDNNFGGSSYYVAAARVTPGGVVLDTGACISSGTGSSEYQAKIAYDGVRCLVVWPKSSGPIYGRFLNNQCQPEGNIFTIASAPAGGPNIAFGGSNYLVVWFAGTYPTLQLYGRLVSPQGVFVGDVISIALGSGCHRWADVAFDGSNYLVVWQTGENNVGQKIYGQFISAEGALVDSVFMICDDTNNERWWPCVAVSDTNFLVAWGQGYGSASNIWGNVDVPATGIMEHVGYAINETGLNLKATPNPFSNTTRIRYSILDSRYSIQDFAINIYDATGRLVREFRPTLDALRPSQVYWDGRDDQNRELGSGVYFLKVEAGGASTTKQLVLVR